VGKKPAGVKQEGEKTLKTRKTEKSTRHKLTKGNPVLCEKEYGASGSKG